MEVKTVEEVLDIVVNTLEGIKVPVNYMEEIGFKLFASVKNLKRIQQVITKPAKKEKEGENDECEG